MGDAFDAARVAAFGYGRSQKLAALWATMKTWLRLFDTEDCYQYNVDKLSTCQVCMYAITRQELSIHPLSMQSRSFRPCTCTPSSRATRAPRWR